MKLLRRFSWVLLLSATAVGLGGGGCDGDDGAATPANVWDAMLWDQGIWQ
jgi:hypothetical protein